MTGLARPNPAMMPKRTSVLPPAPPRLAAPKPPQFVVASSIPRRGVADAVVWPDTGVLLSVHARPDPEPADVAAVDIPGKFRAHYNRRTRLTPRVEREIKNLAWSNKPSERAAAENAVNRLLQSARPLVSQTLQPEDGKKIEDITAQLKALPGATQGKSKHGGEAEIIALASRAARTGGVHILLANDAGASAVAHLHGLATRHAGDVLAELACADPGLDAATCKLRFDAGNSVSTLPRSCLPRDETAFACSRAGAGCAACDPPAA